VHRDGLDHVRVQRALREVARVLDLRRGPLERRDEGVADDDPLLLGVLHAAQRAQELLALVERDERNAEHVAERLLDLLALARAQDAVVDEEAVQPLADRLVEQHRDHRRVHAARHAAHHLPVADPRAQAVELVGDELVHRPVAREPRDPDQEVLEQPHAVVGVHDLRVELQPVDLAVGGAHRGERAVERRGDRLEAARQRGHAVAVAHPDGAGRGDAGEQRSSESLRSSSAARTRARPRPRPGRPAPHQQLHAVADAEHRHAEPEHRRVGARRVGGVDARGSAREHDRTRRERAQLRVVDPGRHDLAVDVELADPARDELRVLSAVVDDDHALELGHYLLSSQ
jgi:hypothetical protein